jgi:hypothetical protein
MDTAAVHCPVEIYLSASDAVTRHNTDFFNDCEFSLSRPIIAPQNHNLYLSVQSFTMPNCLHVVSLYNNHIVINGYDYTLEPGNYSIFQLIAVLTKLDPTVSCRFDNITLKCIFESDTPLTLSGPLLTVLGIADGSSGVQVKSKHTIDMSGVNSIYVLAGDLQCNNGNIDSQPSRDNVLCRIPVSVPAGSVVQYLDQNGRSGLLLDDTVLTSIHLKLEDEDRRPLLATLDWEMCLQCRFIYTGRQQLSIERPMGLILPQLSS